jgi:hypothetical protein
MSGPLDAVAVAAVRTVLPLSRAMTDGWTLRTMLREMGWGIDLTAVDDALLAAIPGAAEIVAAVDEAVGLAQQLADGTAAAGDVAGAVIAMVKDLGPAIERLATFDPAGVVVDDNSALADPSFWTELALDLPEYLLLRYLRDYQAALRAVLRMLGVIVDDVRQSPLLAGAAPADVTRERLVWNNLTALINDPIAHLRDHYGWSRGNQIDHEALVADGAALLRALGLTARLEPIGTEFGPESPVGFWPSAHPDLATARQLRLVVAHAADPASGMISDASLLAVPVPRSRSAGHDVDGIYVVAQASGTASDPVVLNDTWTLTPRSGFTEPGATGLVFSPGSTEVHEPGPDTASGVTLSATPAAPWTLLGGTSGPRLLLHGVELTVDVVVGPPAELVIAARSAGDPGLELIVDAGDGDSFVAALLGAVDVSVPLELGVTWSSSSGFALDAATGLAVDLPIERDIGPIRLATLHLLFVIGTDGASFTAGIDATAALGPFVVTVGNVGLQLAVAPPDGDGSLHTTLAFKPPDGLGLALNAGIVSGGGYLDIDVEAGTYEGVIDLEIAAVGISAVVIVDTKVPGLDGWSVFLALFIDLPSIQLGLGFTLEGVGGIAGINRTVDPDALIAAVRAGSLDTVLFPADPIAAAPEIIATFSAIFPPAAGRYVFGPVAQIGWGTPALVTVSLGVVIELPDPILIAVLGSLTSVLPTTDLDLVELHLDFSGIVDFEAGTLAIGASLHDSSVVGFALAGDMALRAAFTDQPSLVVALGGFHPGFDIPCGFPALQPLSLGISAGDVIDISFECYFAITTNTVQFGAAVALEAKIEGFGVEGGVSFDTLVQFQPFWFTTGIDMHIAVSAGDFELLAVRLYGSLEGPNPWRVIGTAEFEFLGFPKRIHVDERIGSPRADQSVEAPDLLKELCRLVAHEDAWTAGAPAGTSVTLAGAPLGGSDDLVVAPDQTVVVTQRLVPLDTLISKFGESTGLDHERFTIDAVGAMKSSSAPLTDWFAPGQFKAMSPQEQLVAASFELYPVGLELGGGLTSGPLKPIEQGHEQFIRDPLLPELLPKTKHTIVLMSEHHAAAILDTATAATWTGAEVSFVAVVI